jgi:hypothetical protein
MQLLLVKRFSFLGFCTGALLLAAPAVAPAPAHAQSAGAGQTFLPCGITGRSTPSLNTAIADADGRTIARFSGAETTVTVSGFSLKTAAKARVETGNGRGGFRVKGFVETSALPLFTKQEVTVTKNHLRIGKDREVRVVGTNGLELRIERVSSPPAKVTLAAFTPCSTLKLTPGTPPGWSPPGSARGYALRQDALELFSAPQGTSVGTLFKTPGAGALLFFSTEQSGNMVHVEYHADIVVDAWARASDLSALPPGETMDQLASIPPQRSAPRLALPNNPRVVRAVRDVPVRGSAKDGAPVVGVIEPDAEAYVIDIMAGWVSVMPKALDVVPPDGGAFWVKKTELGI